MWPVKMLARYEKWVRDGRESRLREEEAEQCRLAQHISTVSTYHGYKREGLRRYRTASLHVSYRYHR